MGYGGCTGPNTLRFCGAAHCSTIHSHEGSQDAHARSFVRKIPYRKTARKTRYSEDWRRTNEKTSPRSRVVKFHSDWFRISSRSNSDTVTTSAYLCMLTLCASYHHLLFWVHSRCPWFTWLDRLILISFSYSNHLMSLLPCRCCIHFPSDVWH